MSASASETKILDRRTPATPPMSTSVWLLVALGVISAALTFLRMTPEAAGAIWAEDGREFIADRAASSFGADLFKPYAGYLHFVPRILADLTVTFVPSDAWAWSMSIGSSVVVGLVSVAAFLATAKLLPWMPARLALALVPALTPIVVDQIIGNAANIHTYFLWLIPFLFFVFPRRWWVASAVGVLMLVATLTEIQALIFAPLVLWRPLDRKGWPARAGYVIGMGAQAFSALVNERGAYSNGPRPGLVDVVKGWIANGVGGAITGQPATVGSLIVETRWWVLGGATLLLVAALAYVLVRGTMTQRAVAVTLAYGSVASFAVGYVLNPIPGLYYSMFSVENWSTFGFLRYGAPAAMFALSIVVLAMGVSGGRGRRVVPALIAIVLVVLAVTGFRSSDGARGDGPEWEIERDNAVVACENLSEDAPIEVPIAPGWVAPLTCDDLD